jgi:hypothetical protein
MMPNPASTSFTLELGETQGKVDITDAAGRMVYTHANATGSLQIDCTHWQNGTYFVEWVSAAGEQQSTQKLQVLH